MSAEAASAPALLPLAPSQREVWLDQRAWPGSAHLNIGGGGFWVGALDRGLLQRALQALVDECEALRLVPLPGEGPDGEGHQRLLPHWTATLEEVDVRGATDLRGAMREHLRRRMAEPLPLGERPPWRFFLYQGGPELHGVGLQFHHMVMDGWGTTQVMRRWSEHYQALFHRQPLPAAEMGYTRCIADGQEYRNSPAFERDARFWRDRFEGDAEHWLAPLLEVRHVAAPPGRLPAAHVHRHVLPRDEYRRRVEALAAQGQTIAGAMLAAMRVYALRTQGRESLTIAVPSLNRPGARLKRLPGMLVGLMTLPLRVAPADTAAALLARVGQQMQSVLRHSRYPPSALAHDLSMMRLGRDRLADLLLSVERQDYSLDFGQARFGDGYQQFAGLARYGLALTLCEFGDDQDADLVVEASAAAFEPDELPLLARRLWHLVEQLAAQPQATLDELSLVPLEEQASLIEGLHEDLARRVEPPSFIAAFERHAALQPQAPALVWDDDALDYEGLDGAATTLALRLRAALGDAAGAADGPLVALALPRGWRQVAAVLACAKCGAAFLPLDVEAPPARLEALLADSDAALLLAGPDTPEALRALHPRVLALPAEPEALKAPPSWTPFAPVPPDRAAYVLYTSGSTGMPKGVRVPHRSLSRRLAWLAETWAIVPGDRSLQTTQLIFDPSLVELLLPLTQGASIALPPPGRLHPAQLAPLALRHGASFCALVPTTLAGLLDGLADQDPEWRRSALRLRVACCGGEVLSPELALRFQRETGALLYNLYGPTEATIFATAWPCAEGGTLARMTRLPLGRPVDDTRLYVLDPQGRALPFGVAGEICIGGGALAIGYLARPELDRERFQPDPFVPGGRIYRSGDRGWLDPQGLLHFAGRIDRQVKLRGYRIELGDVEAACRAQPGVAQAWADKVEVGGTPRLHAWLALPDLPAERRAERASELLAGLRQRLPDYMVPSSLTLLAELPELPNGKINARGLPAPGGSAGPTGNGRAPTALERVLQDLWQEHLPGHPRPGLEDDFFDLGGDSLAALSILAALEQRMGQRLSLQLLADHPRVSSLARALTRARQPAELLIALDADEALSDDGFPLPTLVLAASGHGDVLRFRTLARALRGRIRLLMLQPPPGRAVTSLLELGTLYADALQPLGTHWLSGFSVGGVTALETACQLQDRGTPPQGLLLLDTISPDTVLGNGSTWRGFGWLVRQLHIQDLSINGRRLDTMFNDPGLAAQVAALRGHRCRTFEGRVRLVKSSGLASYDRLLFRPWRRLLDVRTADERIVPGLHGSIFEPANVDALAQALEDCLTFAPPAEPAGPASPDAAAPTPAAATSPAPAGPLPPELRRRLWQLLSVVVLLLGLTAAWRWTPLGETLHPDRLVPALRGLGESLGPLGGLGVIAGLLALAVPLMPLSLVTMLALGPWWGTACLMGGALAASAINHVMGHWLGHDLLQRLAGPRLRLLSEAMRKRGLLAVIALRLVPAAPFAIVNLAAGATHLRLRDMLLGTAVGMLPGTLALALFSEQVMQALRAPGPLTYALLGLTVALIAGGAWALQRWWARAVQVPPPGPARPPGERTFSSPPSP